MTIKHLVISGGGPILIKILGAIQHLESNKFIDLKNIESVYGTSAGAIMGILICLKFDWETINDYIIKRPWQDVFPIKIENIFDAYRKRGIFDIKPVEKSFKPLFDAKDIPINITLEDFYKFSQIELHMFTFEINGYKVVDVSHLTHPTLPLLTALLMTCALPVLFTPVFMDDNCYIDGGMACNYPLSYCIQSGKLPDEILAFKNKYGEKKSDINSESTLIDFLMIFIFKALFSINRDNKQDPIKHEISMDAAYLTLKTMQNALSNNEVRKDLLNSGIETATKFLSNLENSV